MEDGVEINPTEKQETVVAVDIGEKFQERNQQSKISRLMEYITGLSVDDPKIVDRLEEDQILIRKKYGLPDIRYIAPNLGEYDDFLDKLAGDNGVQVRDKSECGHFFKKYFADAIYFEKDRRIGFDMSKTDRKKYFLNIKSKEHEVIHALQYEFFPYMPVEVMEYEAYVAGFDIPSLRTKFMDTKNKDSFKDFLGFFLYSSVFDWYRFENKEYGRNIKPIWDNPEYFLENIDGFTKEQIENFKESRQPEPTGNTISIEF